MKIFEKHTLSFLHEEMFPPGKCYKLVYMLDSAGIGQITLTDIFAMVYLFTRKQNVSTNQKFTS